VKASALNTFADSILSPSAPATPASPSVAPARGLASVMLAIYGRRLIASLARCDRPSSSSRTSRSISKTDSVERAQISKAEDTELWRAYSRRLKLAGRCGIGASSLWRRPTASLGYKYWDYDTTIRHHGRCTKYGNLRGQVKSYMRARGMQPSNYLNPGWVERVLGWMSGWSDPESALSATASIRYKRLLRSSLLRHVLRMTTAEISEASLAKKE
jgi:hypothetical protein